MTDDTAEEKRCCCADITDDRDACTPHRLLKQDHDQLRKEHDSFTVEIKDDIKSISSSVNGIYKLMIGFLITALITACGWVVSLMR